MNTSKRFLACSAMIALVAALAACSGSDNTSPTIPSTPAASVPAVESTMPNDPGKMPAPSDGLTSVAPSAAPSALPSAPAAPLPEDAGAVADGVAAVNAAQNAHHGYRAYELDYEEHGEWKVSLLNEEGRKIDVITDVKGRILRTEAEGMLEPDDEEQLLLTGIRIVLTDAMQASGATKIDDVDLARTPSGTVWRVDTLEQKSIDVSAETGQVVP